MTITLPDDVREQAERQAKAAGFASVSDYLADLVREDDEQDEPNEPAGGIRTAEQLREAVRVGMASPPVGSVDDLFAKLRRLANGDAA
jgi:Arc/MetJ-type ribon-helix-helix transcriptional regulator